MKKYSQTLIQAVLATAAGVFISSLIISLWLSYCIFSKSDLPFLDALIMSGIVFFLTGLMAILIGLPVAFICFSPMYAFLTQHNWSNYLTVAVLGVIPGCVMLVIKSNFGGWFVLFGVPSAVFSHFFFKRIFCRIRLLNDKHC